MQEWLSQLRAQGNKDYSKNEWPAHADSPLQRNYTAEGDFEPGKYSGGAKAKTKVSLKTKGGVQACTLAELKGKDLELFKEKFGKIVGERAHKLSWRFLRQKMRWRARYPNPVARTSEI